MNQFNLYTLEDYAKSARPTASRVVPIQDKASESEHIPAAVLEYLNAMQQSGNPAPVVIQKPEVQSKPYNAAQDWLARTMQAAESQPQMYSEHIVSGAVESTRTAVPQQLIDSNSKETRKVLDVKASFDEQKLKRGSIVYKLLVVDLFELNALSDRVYNSNLRYSDKINEYYREKFGRSLFNEFKQEDLKLRELIDDRDFPKLYEYGYHSQAESKQKLRINSVVALKLADAVYNDQAKHGFDLSRSELAASTNTYVDEQHLQQTQRTNPLLRKTAQTYGQMTDPESGFFIQTRKTRIR